MHLVDEDEYDVSITRELENVREELMRLQKECGRLKEYTSKQDIALEYARTQASTFAKARTRIQLELDETRDMLMDEERRSASLSKQCIKFRSLLDSPKRQPDENGKRISSLSQQDRPSTNAKLEKMGSQEILPTISALEANISKTLTHTVTRWIRDWHFRLPPTLHKEGHLLQHTLVQLFRACQGHIEQRHKEVVSVFRGNMHPDSERDTQVGKSDSVREHLLRHHQTLFPLQGDDHEKAIQAIVSDVAQVVANDASVKPMRDCDLINRSLVSSGVDRVVSGYFHILVASILQHPAVAFAKECGMVQKFDLKVHSPPIDGDEVKPRCIIVFPALVEAKNGVEKKSGTLSKHYVLSFNEDSGPRR